MRGATEQGHVIAWMADKRDGLIVLLSLIATVGIFPHSLHAQVAKVNSPNLNSILDSLERAAEQNPALSRPHEVTREYKVFEGDDPKPISDVMTQISFTPPDIKTFKITDAQGSPRGQKIVSAILEQEIVSAKEGHRGDISRSNYDFVFLREQNFGVVPEYVLHIIPKRREGFAPWRHLGGCQDIPRQANHGNPAQDSLFLDQRPPHHSPIRCGE